MALKKDFYQFVKETLAIPLVGIAPPDNFQQQDKDRISFVVKTFSTATPIAEGHETVLEPVDFLPDARSVIITGTPGYMGRVAGFEECKQHLLGRAEPSHVNVRFLQDSAERGLQISEFFISRGFQCVPVVGGQFPIKLIASKCGVGYYGKNAIIQHPDYGSWISLSAFVTDAELEPDPPLEKDCAECDLCLRACPTGALFAPYRCDITRCIDFHLGHNKKNIPLTIREKSSNLMGEGCTACRDACPKNKRLKPIECYDTPHELLHPSLLEIFVMTDEQWENTFATTLMGYFLLDKKYLQRNAAIALGNFQDERALDCLNKVLANGDDEVRGYASWAIGRIGGAKALKILRSALDKEQSETVRWEIERALYTIH